MLTTSGGCKDGSSAEREAEGGGRERSRPGILRVAIVLKEEVRGEH